jgi:hypothetical protein
MSSKFGLIDYGRRLEPVLRAQRDVSAILQHSGEAGRAREFFVESVLRRVLPSDVVIGSGEIVDGQGGRSKQQDLLLYRNNFPVIDSLAGSHVYLAEGVLATIEVKSKLDEVEMERVTKNVASVLALDVSLLGLSAEADIHGAVYRLGSTEHEPFLVPAEERIWSFVFAFESIAVDTLTRHAETNGWLHGKGPDCVCVLGKLYGARADAPSPVERAKTDDQNLTIMPMETPLDDKNLTIMPMEAPLGWWLAHMLWTLARPYRRPLLRPYF